MFLFKSVFAHHVTASLDRWKWCVMIGRRSRRNFFFLFTSNQIKNDTSGRQTTWGKNADLEQNVFRAALSRLITWALIHPHDNLEADDHRRLALTAGWTHEGKDTVEETRGSRGWSPGDWLPSGILPGSLFLNPVKVIWVAFLPSVILLIFPPFFELEDDNRETLASTKSRLIPLSSKTTVASANVIQADEAKRASGFSRLALCLFRRRAPVAFSFRLAFRKT